MKLQKEDIISAAVSAASILLMGFFFSLIRANGKVFMFLVPLLMFVAGFVLSMIGDMIKPLKEKKKLKMMLMLIAAAAAAYAAVMIMPI